MDWKNVNMGPKYTVNKSVKTNSSINGQLCRGELHVHLWDTYPFHIPLFHSILPQTPSVCLPLILISCTLPYCNKNAGNVLTLGLHKKRKCISIIKSMDLSLKNRKFTEIQCTRAKEQWIQWPAKLHAHTLYYGMFWHIQSWTKPGQANIVMLSPTDS